MTQDDEKPRCTLYLLTPPRIDPSAFAETLRNTIASAPTAVGALQLRLKDVADEDVRSAARTLLPVCHDAGIPLIVNDRPDVAAEIGADGVHLGQGDADYPSARKLLGDEAIIGITCHDSRDLAIDAGEAGADYVAFGAFFPSASKEAKYHPTPEILRWWSTMTVLPCVAIGGITPENCRPLIEAGADYLAVIGAVWNHPDGPEAAVRAFAAVLEDSPDDGQVFGDGPSPS